MAEVVRGTAGRHQVEQDAAGQRLAPEVLVVAQLDAWFAKANGRTHKTLKVRPVDRLTDEQLAPLPAAMPDCVKRWVTRVAPDPYLRVDTNDYSLDPGLVGRQGEGVVDPHQGPA